MYFDNIYLDNYQVISEQTIVIIAQNNKRSSITNSVNWTESLRPKNSIINLTLTQARFVMNYLFMNTIYNIIPVKLSSYCDVKQVSVSMEWNILITLTGWTYSVQTHRSHFGSSDKYGYFTADFFGSRQGVARDCRKFLVVVFGDYQRTLKPVSVDLNEYSTEKKKKKRKQCHKTKST